MSKPSEVADHLWPTTLDFECVLYYTSGMTGGALRRIRKRLGLTQAALAAEMGTTGNTIARWERGERSIPGPAEKLARLLDQLRGNKARTRVKGVARQTKRTNRRKR